jgi:uncharacterized membrane protein YdjX (TVP38/TMEM64 family)
MLIMLKKVRRFCYVTFGVIFFLFAYNYINTEMAKENFTPMLWLFILTVVVGTFRLLKWRHRRKKGQ